MKVTTQTETEIAVLSINQKAALRQLEILGYKPGETVYLRAFAGKGLKGHAQKIKASFPYIPDKQKADSGLYVVVNGGGHADADVTQCRAIFYEFDDRPIEEQLLMHVELGLPEPSMQIVTRKSAHNYFVVDGGCSVEEWRELQQDLLAYTGADKTLKNPSRVMRLAGGWHVAKDEDPIQCELVSDSGQRFTYSELRSLIPCRQQKESKPEQAKQKDKPIKKTVVEDGSKQLSDILKDEILPRLTPRQIFYWQGHNWQTEAGNKLRGCCPWHESKSGTAFHAEPHGEDGEWLWQCPDEDCKGYQGGGAVEYRYMLNGGTGTPKGIEFVHIVQELAADAGVILPEYKPNQTPTQAQSSSDTDSEDGDRDNEWPDGYWIEDESVERVAYRELFGEAEEWAVIDGTFYHWNGIYWQKQTDAAVQHLISHFLNECYTVKWKKPACEGDEPEPIFKWPFTKEANKRSTFQICCSMLSRHDLPTNDHLVTFLNRTLDVRTGTLHKHEKSDYITSCIPADYQPGMECPEVFLRFLRDSYGEELIPVLRAVIAMFLDPTAPYGKFLYVQGQSGSGKGVLLRTLSDLIGEEASRSINHFGDLSSPEGRHQFLTGAKACIAPDMGGYVSGIRAFYELVDNGALTGRPLFSNDAYQKRWNTRFAVGSVLPLQLENSGDGWDRRAIHLTTKPPTKPRDYRLEEKIRAEKAAIISWALGMERNHRDRILANPADYAPSIGVAQREQALIGDSVKAFIDACLYPVRQGNNLQRISSAELHAFYKAYCEAVDFRPKGLKMFTAHLKSIIPAHYAPKRRLRVDESADREMIGAGWINLAEFPNLFVNVNSTNSANESNGYQGSIHRNEANPVYHCIKSRLQEGQIEKFELLQNGSDTCDGSDTLERGSDTLTQVSDPPQTPNPQASQKNGSDRSNTESIYDEEKFSLQKNEPIAAEKQKSKEITPVSDLSDPKNQDIDGAMVLHGSDTLIQVSDPLPQVSDPLQVMDPFQIGEQVWWNTSGSPWVIDALSEDKATIRNSISGYATNAPLCELRR